MASVRVLATRWLSDDFPGFVEFVLTDSSGAPHTFREKAVVVTADALSASTDYPHQLWIDAVVLDLGQHTAVVRLAHSIESLDGRTAFSVPLEFVRIQGVST